MGFSSLVFAATFILEVVAFGLAVGAATRTQHITVQNEGPSGKTFTCDYKTGYGSSLGFAAGVLLLLAQLAITIFTKCMCSFRHLKRGFARIAAIVLFILSWVSFVIAELFLITGSARGTYELKKIISTRANHCRLIRQTIFGVAAAFTFATLVLGEGSYLCLLKAKKKIKGAPHYDAKELPA